MRITCYNCGKDLTKWPVGRDGRAVLGDDCTQALALGVENPFTKEREQERIERQERKGKKKVKEIKRLTLT